VKENEQSLAANKKFLLGFTFCGLSFDPEDKRVILTEA